MANHERDTAKIDEQAERLRKMRLNMEYGDEMQGIVRRLATYANERQLFVLIEDAERLWAKMQQESEGQK